MVARRSFNGKFTAKIDFPMRHFAKKKKKEEKKKKKNYLAIFGQFFSK